MGAADGSTAILQISDGLSVSQGNEKQGIGIMLEREARREKNLEARIKEQKQKQKREVPPPPVVLCSPTGAHARSGSQVTQLNVTLAS